MKTQIPEDPEADNSAAADFHEQVARLAYALWQERGCPDGSSEADWFRAEQQLQSGTATEAQHDAAAA
ncbi:MAG: DUF2934 domain-containing protein [Acidobacteriia bacterium]|nr:DUF2934 domain-containing protein [Terriglobia bacterium]